MTEDGSGVVGDRTLIAIQAVNISRLSTHPVPIVPGTLIVVAGQGPKDSNGAGKSSFIASITALLGDEQWRFASGARAVAELLFNAELAAQGDSKWASADHGYIVGVFGDTADGRLTVWLRVNTAAPHLEIRWTEGIHLASASSEAERVALADELWAALPRSAGRRDLVAKDLGRVLYGERVRCVSFLSTSVRTKVATNLLSQPLNEISPERIFSAISALTGLDRELESERKARAEEHRERTKAAEAATLLADWEAESEALISTFDRRDRAREALAAAQRCWRARQARLLTDAAERDAAWAAEQERLRGEIQETTTAIKAVGREIDQLSDRELEAQLATAAATHTELKARVERLGEEKAVAKNRIEELRRHAGELEERQRGADGRDLETAREELAEAERRRDEAQQDLGLAKGTVAAAERELADTEAGEGAAREQIHALAAAGIPAVGLVDVVDLTESVRARWEAVLWPYREAVVTGAGDTEKAAEVLRKLPGSMIIPADGPLEERGTPARLPTGAGDGDPCPAIRGDGGPLRGADGVGSHAPLRRFFSALADRQGSDAVDEALGVIVIGGFPDAVTGRVARVEAARARLAEVRESFDRAGERVEEAASAISLASGRLAGARAERELAGLRDKIDELRGRLETLTASADELTPQLRAAEQEIRRLQAKTDNRTLETDRLRGRKETHERTRDQARDKVAELAGRRATLTLAMLSEDWGGTPEAAQEWLLTLDEDERSWSPEEWWHSAEKHLGDALRRVFPEGREDADAPEEVRFLLTERAEGQGRRTEREQNTFPRLAQALGSYLRGQEEYEQHQRRQIEIQRAARRSDLEKAQKGAAEATGAATAHRSALTAAIRSRLQAVSDEFARLDLAYGGYGATLEFPTPEPPPDPEHEWRWRVIPKWRRADGQRYVPYNRRANTALMDEKAVKLVCAAALASAGGGRLCLVLDELGRNLGKEHRREAVALFRQIGETHGITVIGALQDDMEPYAIDACGQYVKLRRSSDAMAYNEPPVVVGYDLHAERVRALAAAMDGTRPAVES